MLTKKILKSLLNVKHTAIDNMEILALLRLSIYKRKREAPLGLFCPEETIMSY